MTERKNCFVQLEQNGGMEGKEEKSCLGMTRRTFIKGFGTTLVALSVPRFAFSSDDRSRVAIVRHHDIETMTRKAIHLAGGLDEIQSGQTVIIKPNLVTASDDVGNRVTTHPEVLRAVIRAVKERTAAANITVGDKSAFNYITMDIAQSTGIYQVCVDEGVNFMGFENGTYTYFTHPDFSFITTPIFIPSSLATFDHFINVPICKNHHASTVESLQNYLWLIPPEYHDYPPDFVVFYARHSLCMKNFVGLLPFELQTPNTIGRIGTGLHSPNIGRMIAELNLCVPGITMNVIDAVSTLVHNGPAGPGAVYTDPQIVIASKDRVACDTVGLALLKHQAKLAGITEAEELYINESVWTSPQIARAAELGIGKASPADIKVINGGVEELEQILYEWI